jgi:hypothetical protein
LVFGDLDDLVFFGLGDFDLLDDFNDLVFFDLGDLVFFDLGDFDLLDDLVFFDLGDLILLKDFDFDIDILYYNNKKKLLKNLNLFLNNKVCNYY